LAVACKHVRIDRVGYLEEGVKMADFGVFIGFGPTARGRERQAIKLFDEASEYYTRLQQQGEIESFEPVMLEPHGGDLSGFFLLRGDRDKLASILASDEFTLLSMRADLLLERFGVVGAVLGERIGTVNRVYNEQVEELT
jgi:hypothetical protein